MLVGEIAGDEEDRAGRPFVGPAGRILDRGLEEAGIDREEAYVTNVVKHFKWEPKGKRRLHKKPHADEIRACLPWLEAEIAAVRPEVIVCLGATAARTLVGPSFRVTRDHGRFVDSPLARTSPQPSIPPPSSGGHPTPSGARRCAGSWPTSVESRRSSTGRRSDVAFRRVCQSDDSPALARSAYSIGRLRTRG